MRPDDDRAAAVPAVHRVAVVAHVALVLRGVGLQRHRRRRRAHLGIAHGRDDRLRRASGRVDPAVEGDLPVDELIELELIGLGFVVVVVVVVFLVVVPRAVRPPPAPPAAPIVSEAAPGFVDFGERQHGVAAGEFGGGPQCRHAGGVVALESGPAHTALGVLMVEEIDEPVRWPLTSVAASATRTLAKRRREVLTETSGQRLDGSGRGLQRRGRIAAAEQQVVRQHDPVARMHWPDLVTAVGVEGDQGQHLLRAPVRRRLPAVLDDQRPALQRRGQGDDERGDHLVALLRVLMRDEELPPGVNEHRLQLSDQPRTGREAEIGAQALEHRLQCPVPPPLVDRHPAQRDLPGVPHPGVEQRLRALAVACRAGETAQLTCLRRRHREPKWPEPFHLDRQGVRRRRPAGAERTASTHPAKQNGDPLPRRRGYGDLSVIHGEHPRARTVSAN